MFSAPCLIVELGRREREVRAAVAHAEHERLALRRAAHRFAARLAYGFGRPTGLAACFAAGCAIGARRTGAGALLAAAWKVGRLGWRQLGGGLSSASATLTTEGLARPAG